MSIALMSEAFKTAIPATRKLVFLALCDSANDQGECYPSVSTLVAKCSSGERTIQEAISWLEAQGFIRREFRTGRSTVYWVTNPRIWRTPADYAPPQIAHPTPAAAAPPPPQIAHPTPADCAPITIIEPSVEPSGNQIQSQLALAGTRPAVESRQQTRAGHLAKPKQPQGPPDCPHLDVLALWAEVLPALPQHDPLHWRGARADHLRARWRETAVAKRWQTQTDGLDYLRKLFGYVGKSGFLTGRAPPSQRDRRPFVIELEWLVMPTNWAKVHEGKYHAEEAAA